MSESSIVRVRSLPDGSVVQVLPDGSTIPYIDPHPTDWARLEAMSEEEIDANALSDPDNPPLTDEELARARRIPDPARIRRRLGIGLSSRDQITHRPSNPQDHTTRSNR